MIPPLNPGTTYQPVLDATLTLAGDASSLDVVEFTSNLASYLNVEAAQVQVEIEAASVRIHARIFLPTLAEAQDASSRIADVSSLSSSLGWTVEEMESSATMTVLHNAPSAPPAPVPESISPPSPQLFSPPSSILTPAGPIGNSVCVAGGVDVRLFKPNDGARCSAAGWCKSRDVLASVRFNGGWTAEQAANMRWAIAPGSLPLPEWLSVPNGLNGTVNPRLEAVIAFRLDSSSSVESLDAYEHGVIIDLQQQVFRGGLSSWSTVNFRECLSSGISNHLAPTDSESTYTMHHRCCR